MVLAVIFTVCNSWAQKDDDNTIVFSPHWTAQAQYAGYYVAEAKGFYREAGIKVKIQHPAASQSAMSMLLSNQVQVTIMQLAQALAVVDNGTPLVNILQTSMNSALMIVSARGKDPLKQKGQRVGIWNVYSGITAQCMCNREHLNYQWIYFAQNINLFLAGVLDAMVVMSYNEYYQLLQAGIELGEKNVYRFCEHNYNVQQDGVYMTRQYYENHKEQARRFAKASRKGWEWTAQHPEEALDIVMKYVGKEHVATNRVMQRLMLEEILRQQVDRESKKREFRLRPDMVKLASQLMLESNLLRREVTYKELSTF
jgi:NitT/TauT family transport system substrate-binding protein